MRVNNVEIVCNGIQDTRVWINHVEIEGLKRVEFNASSGDFPTVLIESIVTGSSDGSQR